MRTFRHRRKFRGPLLIAIFMITGSFAAWSESIYSTEPGVTDNSGTDQSRGKGG